MAYLKLNNGIKMYYEVHKKRGCSAPPILLLHGSFFTAHLAFDGMLKALKKERTVILVEMQGHGHTNDIDRELAVYGMGSDVVDLMLHLGYSTYDVFGWSMGGNTALWLAVHYPDLLNRVVVSGANYSAAEIAWEPGAYAFMQNFPAEFKPPVLYDAYVGVAPEDNWVELVQKVKRFNLHYAGFSSSDIVNCRVPMLIMYGDTDQVRLTHGIDWVGLARNATATSGLSVLENTTHSTVLDRPDRVVDIMLDFM